MIVLQYPPEQLLLLLSFKNEFFTFYFLHSHLYTTINEAIAIRKKLLAAWKKFTAWPYPKMFFPEIIEITATSTITTPIPPEIHPIQFRVFMI